MTFEESALQLLLTSEVDLEEHCLKVATRKFAEHYGLPVPEVSNFVEKETFAKEYGVEIDVLLSALDLNHDNWEDAILWGAFEWDVL